MKLRVAYSEPAQLLADHDTQMVKGGLLVRGEPPAGIDLFANVELELSGPFPPLEQGLAVVGQVVQIVAGVGVAVVFDPKAFAAAIATVRESQGRSSPVRQSGSSETAAKIQLALHGNKDERFRILRDSNRLLHAYVLKNPGLGLDEVVAMARMSTLAPEVLNSIAERKEWAQRADVAISLVRNPKTPTPTAVRLLEYVAASDLRQLAKDSKTRPAVQQAARKRVLGG